MKRKNIIIGTLSFTAISAALYLIPFNFLTGKGAYNQESLSVFQEKSASDARIWLEARYLDLETGVKITPEKLNEILLQEKNRKRSGLVFEELGPDNIGGRTRAVQPDRNDPNKVWAGGVSGGLFYSENGANTWNRVDDFIGLPYISSITQTEDGTIFVGTGSYEEGWSGNGLHYKSPNSSTWQTVPGTSSFSIGEVESPLLGNTVFIATNSGLKKWTVGNASLTSVNGVTGSCNALKITEDGQVIVVSVGSTNKVFVSTDGGTVFTDKSGSVTSLKVPIGSPRIELAVSSIKNASDMYSLYAVRTNSNLLGMHVSHDNGSTWNQFVGASGTPSNLDIYRDQGTYNSIVSVVPNDPERILLGGIDIWEWKQTVNNPPAGGFEPHSQWFLNPTNELYVHADNHEMKWDSNDRLYIGNDGGIGISNDYASTFYPANRGYNVTQFYGIAFDKDGSVMGGAQDNGTLYNDFSNNSYKEFTEIGGGDGFACAISFFNPNIIFTSSYNNAITRIGKDEDSGEFVGGGFSPSYPSNYTGVGEPGSGFFPFSTAIFLAEYFDTNSKDSVIFSPTANYAAGSVVKVPSLSTGNLISYTTPTALYFDDTVFADPNLTVTNYKITDQFGNDIDLGINSYTTVYNAAGSSTPPGIGDSLLINGSNLVKVVNVVSYEHYFAKNTATNEIFDLETEDMGFNVKWDTITVADPYQSWFLVYAYGDGAVGGELWGTRDALRLSSSTKWVKFATGLGTNSVDVEFSKDLNHCFISCGKDVYRVDGLGDVYSQDATFSADVTALGAAKLRISTLDCEGIALNPNNANDLILLQGFSGSISRSANATSAVPTFTNLSSLGVGAYDAIIDRLNPQVIVVGTAFGVKVSENGGGSWQDASAGFEDVPVYEVKQNWRTWNEGSTRNGEIYLGTFGRGIWASTSLLGLGDDNNEEFKSLKTNLKVYPNPTNGVSVISFNLLKTSNVSVKVYNLSGVLVKSFDVKNMEKGAQAIDLNASNLSDGTYIIKLDANNTNETVKFVKL